MTGVEVTPISGLTWPQPRSSLEVSPDLSIETCQITVPVSASKAYTESCSVATMSKLCVPFDGTATLDAYNGSASTLPSTE